MEVVGLVLASVGATSKVTEAVWVLCSSWSNAPASIHELRDFLTRTQDFWAAVQYGLESSGQLIQKPLPQARSGVENIAKIRAAAEWEARSSTSLIRLLQQGLEALDRLGQILEQVTDGTDSPCSQLGKSTPAALSSRRKFQWVRKSGEVRKIRMELSRNNDLIYGHLLVLNV
jgi:hypothetical protein